MEQRATREWLIKRLDALLEAEAERFVADVPYAAHLTDFTLDLDPVYYLRHRIETIRRIRMTAKTDALALAKLVDLDYDSARGWAKYAVEELNHDRLFLGDLARHGYDDETILNTSPFPATRALLGYLEDSIETIGPLAAAAYSLFVEWNSARYSEFAVRRAETAFSRDHVVGSLSHVGIDHTLDHVEAMVDLSITLLERASINESVLFGIISDIASLLRDYFRELYDETVGARLQSLSNSDTRRTRRMFDAELDVAALRERLKSKDLTDEDISFLEALLSRDEELRTNNTIGGRPFVARLPFGMDVIK
jgi:hypothetical protein